MRFRRGVGREVARLRRCDVLRLSVRQPGPDNSVSRVSGAGEIDRFQFQPLVDNGGDWITSIITMHLIRNKILLLILESNMRHQRRVGRWLHTMLNREVPLSPSKPFNAARAVLATL